MMKSRMIFLAVTCFAVAHAQNTPPQNEVPAPAPDLLKDIAGRPAMRLEQFQQFALTANPTVRQASALTRESAALARQAGMLPNPSIGYEGSEIRGGSFRGGEQGAFVQQSFLLGGKLGLRRDVFKQQERGAELAAEEQRSRILSDVTQSYYAALAAQELVKVRKNLLDLAKDAVETAHQLANVGQADAPDVLQAEVEADQAGVDYTTAQRTYIQEFRTLAAVVGKPDLLLAAVTGDLQSPPNIDSGRIIGLIVQDSPSIKHARQDILRAEAELKSARRESVPDLQIRAGLQQNFEPLNGTTGNAVGAQGFVTASMMLPIFNRNQGNVEASKVEVERAQAELERVELSLRRSAEPLLQSYLSARDQANRYKNEMIPRATRAYQLYLAKYRQMGAAYPQVIVSQRTLFGLQAAYIAVLENVWNNAIALQNYALSGGLDAPAASGTIGTGLNPPNAIAP